MPDPLSALIAAGFLLLAGAVLLWPERGLIPRWRRAGQVTERVLIEDALKHIHTYEMGGRKPTMESIAGALNITADGVADIVLKMEELDLLTMQQGEFHLTPAGRNYALHIIRAHRLWERYLADKTGYQATEWHDQAER